MVNKVEFDFSELRGRIVTKYGNGKALAAAVGISEAQLSDRLNNKVAFRPDEIPRLCGLLEIAVEEIGKYFFTPKV